MWCRYIIGALLGAFLGISGQLIADFFCCNTISSNGRASNEKAFSGLSLYCKPSVYGYLQLARSYFQMGNTKSTSANCANEPGKDVDNRLITD